MTDINGEKTFHITTFGCQMNERDSETLAGMLTELGYTENDVRDDADIMIINTCSVREHADERFFGTLGQLKKVKEKRPGATVCLCGCMMQQQHIIDRVKQKFPWVDIIFGTHNIHEFPKLIAAVASQKEMQVQVEDEGGEIVEGLPSKRKYPFKAFVNITFGCNNFCTYCIVPYTRGRERSRRAGDIVREIEALAQDGVKEVTLLGQNVNSYRGGDASGGAHVDFPDLIGMISDVDGIERIRFMTSHPKDLSPKLIEAFRKYDKLCGHIHLPVQAGSDAVLKRMNRHYTAEHYLSLLGSLREARPGIAVSTDIIVGFPGETEDDFEKTLELCRRARFDSAFTFIYSVRKGTPAEKYTDQVPEVKHERFGRLVDVINEGAAAKNAALKGRVLDVLVEGKSRNGEGMVQGRTDGFKLVDFPGEESLTGSIVSVEITEGRTFSLRGRMVGR